jgi:hypothetical protein
VLPPTPDDLRNWSTVRWERAGVPDDDMLQLRIDRAVGYVCFITGQSLDALFVPTWSAAGSVEALMNQAIQLRTEQITMQGVRGHVASAGQNEVVSSFSAGSYSESRREPGHSKGQQYINTWPQLDELLWMLMTDDRRGDWMEAITGQTAPAFWVEEVEWGNVTTLATYFEPWDRYVPAGIYSAAM